MKSLTDKAIVYDDQCPACSWYTAGFVKWGVLEKGNRISFSQLTQCERITQIDLQRARHEIPLIDLQGGQTIYGLDALILVLSQRIPVIRNIIKLKPAYVFFSGLYNLISYNRRIILPAINPAPGFDCAPDFSLRYRLYLLALSIMIASIITYGFGISLSHFTGFSIGGTDMLCIAGTGWVVQILLALCAPVPFLPQQRINYITHLGVIMVIGALILLPGICLSALTDFQYPAVAAISVLISSGTMLWQHISRVHHLQLSQRWTASWFIILQMTALVWLFILT